MDFPSLIRKEFNFLIEEGYDLQEKQIGRETYFDFNRGFKTISISSEPDSYFVLEIFEPVSVSTAPPVPWAEKDGIARSRRFPLSEKNHPRLDPTEQLKRMARDLAALEQDWKD